jgi:sialidase-1
MAPFLLLLAGSGLVQTDLFRAGEGGAFAWRTPSILVTSKGTVLVFAAARRNSLSDHGDIDMGFIRSTDGGNTWSKYRVIADFGPDSASNACSLFDRQTGKVWLFITSVPGAAGAKGVKGKRAIIDGVFPQTVWAAHSTDDGVTWSKPQNLTDRIEGRDPKMTFYGNGPGTGIQLQCGRLVVPRYFRWKGEEKSYAHVIYSDDHGVKWKQGAPTGELTNEHQVVELSNGALMMNARSYHGKNRRAIAFSYDKGETWTQPVLDDELVEPVCQAGFIGFRRGPRTLLVFSNPASTERRNMTVKLSADEGKTWPAARLLHPGPAAYSSLAVLADARIACLYERGEKGPYEKITLARFSLAWLEGGGGKLD